MSNSPDVTIVLPLHDDELWVEAALDSCLSQTWTNLEVICVDDASGDATASVVERVAQRDQRVRLFRQPVNRTAFQARRVGVENARAPHILFLDGDDQLRHDAVAVALRTARKHDADLVGFGVEVVVSEGEVPGRFAAELQPAHSKLSGGEIVAALFPAGRPAQGHLWRYLWATRLVREAYGVLDPGLQLPRANDIPIAFLGAALAEKYVSTGEKLYRYFWKRGVSGKTTESVESFEFYLSAIDSLDAMRPAIASIGARRAFGGELERLYDSARLSMIQVLLRRCEQIADSHLREQCLGMVTDRVGGADAVRSAAVFFEPALTLLARGNTGPMSARGTIKTVMLTTGNLQTGGVQGVLAAQARQFSDIGLRVVIAIQNSSDIAFELPPDVTIIQVSGQNRAEKIAHHLQICRDHEVDVIVDHHILYNQNWPFYALAARMEGVPTIGWLHNFALRPLYDSNLKSTYLAAWLPILDQIVVLSKSDVAFWKLRGVDRVAYLPNPPSPWLAANPIRQSPRRYEGEPIGLVWWGRLQQHTKRVRHLVDLAAALDAEGVDYRLTIIGPDSGDTTVDQMKDLVIARGVQERVLVTGALHGDDLLEALEKAHVHVSMSGIEGYPLTLLEAQALGMPVVMYDLPWLATLEENAGVARVSQGDLRSMVSQIALLSRDPESYRQRSAASLVAARRALDHDFSVLYPALLNGQLSPELYSPAPTDDDARLLLELAIDFSEEGMRRAKRVEKRAQGRADELRRQLLESKRRLSKLQRDLQAESQGSSVAALRDLASRIKRRLLKRRSRSTRA